ncbi:MAG: hypothetical protein GY715_01935 [Planctomycetes bacterium]|nr:hypothetical protein [Planctomycetota bacterium]
MHEPTAIESAASRRGAQERLLQLAGMYRGLSRRELAQALGRDPSNLFPPNGNPKLDYLARLAGVLDWPLGDVAEAILVAPEDGSPEADDETFADIDTKAKAAHMAGDYAAMRTLAERMERVATMPDQRALAALREGGAWDGMGRYTAQLEAIRRGLQEDVTRPDLRLLLRSNLANAHYTLWYLFEARSMARELIDGFDREAPSARPARAARAFSHYVLGNTDRRLLGQQPENRVRFARTAFASLREAKARYDALAAEFDHDGWRGVANTCRGAIIESEVALGDRDPESALDELTGGVEGWDTGDDAGDRLESRGWWCIFGCNIALRHLDGRELQRHMAKLAPTGSAIAARLGNWAMRERLFTLELMQRQRLNELAGFAVDWTIRQDDVKVLVGTMGRFPSFRNTGWRILQEATVVGSN